jgi:hypothetical protein
MKFSSERAGQRAGWLDLGDFVMRMNTHLEGRSSVRAIRASLLACEFREYCRKHGAGFESRIRCQVIASRYLGRTIINRYIVRCYSPHIGGLQVNLWECMAKYCPTVLFHFGCLCCVSMPCRLVYPIMSCIFLSHDALRSRGKCEAEMDRGSGS